MGVRILFAALLAISSTAMTQAAGSAGDADASVVAVAASGAPNAYTFEVTVRSNDTGMDHYADWWEVVDARGRLAYRRVLLHDHADEQPFARDGGPVPIGRDDVVTVRVHVYSTGYSSEAMRGSVATGFSAHRLERGFAAELEKQPPLPAR